MEPQINLENEIFVTESLKEIIAKYPDGSEYFKESEEGCSVIDICHNGKTDGVFITNFSRKDLKEKERRYSKVALDNNLRPIYSTDAYDSNHRKSDDLFGFYIASGQSGLSDEDAAALFWRKLYEE